MPGMLVYVAEARLAELRGAGARWTIRRGELVPRDLLGPSDWTLYIATLREGRVRVIGYLEPDAGRRGAGDDELGDAALCDVDITPILERLGCLAGAGGFAAWAARPRVLTPGDRDLLRYRLGLPLDVVLSPPVPVPERPPPPTIRFADDALAIRLLAAVHEDVGSDAERMVLADRLLELGEPRGELIALQLARARTGAPATERERELIAQHGRGWLEPLAPCLASFEFRKGFLAAATTDDGVAIQPAWYEHPLWITVEELETEDPRLLVAPALRSLRRVAIAGKLLEPLARHPHPLGIDTIVGRTTHTQPFGRLAAGGLALPAEDLPPLGEAKGLDRLRAMCLSIETPVLTERAGQFLRTRLGGRLEHVELFCAELAAAAAEPWGRVATRNGLMSLGLRGFVGGWRVVVVRQRSAFTVQIGKPFDAGPPDLRPIEHLIASLGQGMSSVTLELVGEVPTGTDSRFAVRELQRRFSSVTLASLRRWRSL